MEKPSNFQQLKQVLAWAAKFSDERFDHDCLKNNFSTENSTFDQNEQDKKTNSTADTENNEKLLTPTDPGQKSED